MPANQSNLCLWKMQTRVHSTMSTIPVSSHISKAQGMWGKLSRRGSKKTREKE